MGITRKPEYVVWENSDPITTLLCYMTEGPLLRATFEGKSLAPAPYQWADINYRLVDPDSVRPTATYVLRGNLQNLAELSGELIREGFDIFDLKGMLRIGEDDFISPPVLEVWTERPYCGVPVVVDGAHRLWQAIKLKRKVGCVVVSGKINSMLPVLPLDSWKNVSETDAVPEIKRLYAKVPKPYRPSDLYRVGFPGSTGLRPIGAKGN